MSSDHCPHPPHPYNHVTTVVTMLTVTVSNVSLVISLVSFSHNELNELELSEQLKPVYFAIMREIVSEEQVQLSQSELAASLQSYVKRNSVLSRNKVNKFSRAFVDVNIGICYIKIRYDNLMIPPSFSYFKFCRRQTKLSAPNIQIP